MIPVNVVGAVIVYTSVAGFGPLANNERSASLAKSVPLADAKEDGFRTVQFAVTLPPVGSPSANKDLSSVVTDSRKRPRLCPGFECVCV